VQLSLLGNSFHNVSRTGLSFQAPPPVEGSRIVLKNNHFEQVKQLARIEGFRPEPARTNAAWIAADSDRKSAGKAGFRKRFRLDSVPSRALLSVVADASFTLWVNGQRAGQGEFSETTRHVPVFDVARHLQRGDNLIAIEVLSREGGVSLLTELTDNVSGTLTPTVVSDASWKVSRKTEPGWTEPGFEDDSWSGATVVGAYGKAGPTEMELIWEAVIQEQFRYQAAQVFPAPEGNERDVSSMEGFPNFGARLRE
jgi:hypothetical protein